MISPKYLIYHDLIGFKAYAKLKSKSNKTTFSDIGMIIDDTRNMLMSEKNNTIKNYIKKDYIFRLKLEE